MARSGLTKISLRVTLYTRKLVRTERNIFKFAVGSIYARNRRIIISRGNIRGTGWSISISLVLTFARGLLQSCWAPFKPRSNRIKQKKKKKDHWTTFNKYSSNSSTLSNSSIRTRYIVTNGDGKYGEDWSPSTMAEREKPAHDHRGSWLGSRRLVVGKRKLKKRARSRRTGRNIVVVSSILFLPDPSSAINLLVGGRKTA